MKKLMAVSFAVLLSSFAISVNAQCLTNNKISVSDIFDRVKENHTTNKSTCLDAIMGLICDEEDCLSDIKDIILDIFENDHTADKPESEKPEVEEPEAEKPEVEKPEADKPEVDEPETDKPEVNEPEVDKPENLPPVEQEKPEDSYESQNGYINEVLSLVNSYRKQNGLSALTLDYNLCNAADIRAKEIKSSFSHTRPNGTSCFTVLKELGISYNGAGENIAYGQSSPQEVMTAWMNSQGHRENILNASFTKLGVGVYSDGSTLYWAQMFAS